MDIHYHAFISYRHHPEDIKAATQIHRALEHYRIPLSLKKKLNFRGPMRLFRDKEELPITSNLNDDINTALKNSDYLIVICSVHTKESIWVQREIQQFLKTHSHKQILTVLVNGEPYDVIPEILLHEEKTDPVTGEVIQELIEPLSCDLRIGRRKAMREELPRLAASLLGCSYDELRLRQRQYRIRRLIAFFCVALAASLSLAAYFLRTSIIIQEQNVQIQANLDDSLRNQSRHLATAARERLAEGDRLTAIALAAAALPDENNTRPYVPEAEKTMVEALGIYQQNTQTIAAGILTAESQANIQNFYVSPSGKLLLLHDDKNYITAWDTATLEKRSRWDFRDYTIHTILPNDTTLLYSSGTEGPDLICVSADGQLLWQVESCYDLAITDDGATVLALDTYAQQVLLFLDARTGKPLQDALDLNTLPSGMTASGFFAETIPAGFPIPLRCMDGSFSSTLFLLDPQDRSFRQIDVLTYRPQQAIFAENGNLLLMTYAESDTFSGYFESSRINAPMRRQVCCYDTQTGEQLWQTQIDSSSAGTGTLHQIPGADRILCQSGPVFQIVDLSTGQTVNRCEAGSGIICVSMGEDYAQAILEDGYLCNYWYEENYCYETQCLQGGLSAADIRTDYYGLQYNSNHITVYRKKDPPVLWQYRHDFQVFEKDQRVWGQQWAFADYNNLYLLDLNSQAMRWVLELPNLQLLDFSQEGSTLWAVSSSYEDTQLISIDTAAGKYTSRNLESADSCTAYLFRENCLYYTQGVQIFCLDLLTDETASLEIPAVTQDSVRQSKIAGQYEQYLWVWLDNGQFLEVDITTGKTRTLAEDVENCPVAAVNDDGTVMAACNAAQILLTAPGGEDLRTITAEDGKAGNLYFLGEDLLVLCDNGYLYRYDPAGILLSRTALETGGYFSDLLTEVTQNRVSWQITKDGKLVVNACGTGNVIDTTDWNVSAVIPDYRLYWEDGNIFVCSSSSGFSGYPNHSVPQLLELAHEELANFHMTEDQKRSYGIQ